MESNHGLENYGQDLLVLILEHSNSDFFFFVFFNHRTCLRSLSVLRSPAFLGSKQPTTFNYYCTTACLPRPRDPHGSAGGTNLDPPAPRVLALRHRDHCRSSWGRRVSECRGEYSRPPRPLTQGHSWDFSSATTRIARPLLLFALVSGTRSSGEVR
jgi:hypothetical protein